MNNSTLQKVKLLYSLQFQFTEVKKLYFSAFHYVSNASFSIMGEKVNDLKISSMLKYATQKICSMYPTLIHTFALGAKKTSLTNLPMIVLTKKRSSVNSTVFQITQ